MSRLSLRDVLPLLGAAWLLSLGCGATARPQSPEERNLKALAVLLGKYRSAHAGKAPANLDALKAHVKKTDASTLKGLDIDPANTDSMFTSTRDNKPFVLRQVKGSGVPEMGPDGQPKKIVLLHETDGASGRRWVAYDLGGTEDLDATKFKQLVPEAP